MDRRQRIVVNGRSGGGANRIAALVEDRTSREFDVESLQLDRVSTAMTDLTLGNARDLKLKNYVNPNDSIVDQEIKNHFAQEFTYQNLSITSHLQTIANAIQAHKVTIISAPTGSGKTTQIPQYIAERLIKSGQQFNAVVTQPRRIAATSVARRVCEERNWELGSFCGYQIALDRSASNESTRLLYVTTGVLLQRLINQKSLDGYTHIFIDEVHERSEDTDLLLMMVRELMMVQKAPVKLIIMSATMDMMHFKSYFYATEIFGTVHTYDVGKQQKRIQKFYADENEVNNIHPISDHLFCDFTPKLLKECVEYAAALISNLDDYEVGSAYRGAVLVFLPGYEEISIMRKALNRCKSKLFIIPLHSTITVTEQSKVFEPSIRGERKIILSTNIAESSITVPDVDFVIDFCLHKTLILDPVTRFPKLTLEWASKANCDQRAGRTGRIRKGYVFRMVTRKFYDSLPAYQVPEMARSPLNLSVLRVKRLATGSDIKGSPKDLLLKCIEPPIVSDIKACVRELKQVGAFTVTMSDGSFDDADGELTALGDLMAKLPIDIRLSKLIFLGYMFGVLDDTIIIAACLSLQNMFSHYHGEGLNSYLSRLAWADSSMSDLIAYLNAYKMLKKLEKGGYLSEDDDRARASWCKVNFIEEKRIREVNNLVEEIRQRVRAAGIDLNLSAPNQEPDPKEDLLVLRFVICGAFYPNYFLRQNLDQQDIARQLSGHDPCRSVWIKGFPIDEAFIYINQIKELFRDVSHAIAVDCQSSVAVLTFANEPALLESFRDQQHFHSQGSQGSSDDESLVYTSVYMAIKMKREERERFTFMRVSSDAKIIILDHSTEWQALRNRFRREFLGGDFEDTNYLEANRYVIPPYYQTYTLDLVAIPEKRAFDVEVLYVTGCGNFWIRVAQQEYFNALNLVHESANLFAARMKSRSVKENKVLFDPEHNKLYQGAFILINASMLDLGVDYARAYVTRYDPSKRSSELFFVDLGVSANLSDYFDEMYPITENLTDIIAKDRSMLALVAIPALARECVIPAMKPIFSGADDGIWRKEAREFFENLWVEESPRSQFYVKVYSVMNDVVRADLYWRPKEKSYDEVKDTENEHSFRRELIERGFAEPASESNASMLQHRTRYATSERTRVIRPQQNNENHTDLSHWDVEPIRPRNDETCMMLDDGTALPRAERNMTTLISHSTLSDVVRDQMIEDGSVIQLTGPCSPLESKFYGMTRATSERIVGVEASSVNSIFLEWDYTSPNSRMIVAATASMSQGEGSNKVIARATTVMPNIPGFPALMCMVFSPQMELRLNKEQDTYIGALFGLGADPKTRSPYHAEQDIEMEFNVTIFQEDIFNANQMRAHMNDFMVGIAKGGLELVRIRTELRELMRTLIFRTRSQQVKTTRQHFVNYDWFATKDAHIDIDISGDANGKNEEVPLFSRSVYQLHRYKAIDDEAWRTHIAHNIIKLEKMVTDGIIERGSSAPMCYLCGQVSFFTVKMIEDHINEEMHVERLKQFLRILDSKRLVAQLGLDEVLLREGLN